MSDRLKDVIELVNEVLVEATRFADAKEQPYSEQDPETLAIANAARREVIDHLQRVYGGLID
jgi:hypothetical protein